jgi:regulator of protease activity HflC (stomatin/prohibitin superfamily)
MQLATSLFVIALIAVLVFILGRLLSAILRRTTVHDYEVGLHYVSGRLRRTLPPGGHWLWRPFSTVRLVDLRTRIVTVPAQEVLSADNVSVRASLLLRYKVVRPELAINGAVDFEEAIYADAQLALREIAGGLAVEDLVAKRDELGAALEARVKPRAEILGIALESAGIKDLIFPPMLRQVFHQVVEARKASQASLERARGEVATLRSLANAARMLENNPGLLALRTLQTATDGKHTLVLGAAGPFLPLPTPGSPAPAPPDSPTTGSEGEAA